MQRKQSVVLDTGRYVQAFLDENASHIGPIVASSRRNLDDAVMQLTAMVVTQGEGSYSSRGATARQTSLRTRLRVNHMKPIAEVARQKLREVPDIESLRMPGKRLGTTQLVAAARAMANAAQLYHSVFTEVGLPDDFIARLHAVADAVTVAQDARQVQVSRSTSATAGIRAQGARLRSVFRLINALIVPELGSNVVLLAKWRATKAIARKSAPVAAEIATPATTTVVMPAGVPLAVPTPPQSSTHV